MFFEESHIKHDGLSFLITKGPDKDSVKDYVKLLKSYNTTVVIRACAPTYPVEYLEKNGITVHDMNFPDGDGPPKAIKLQWMRVLSEVYNNEKGDKKSAKPKTIALHCVAGLGRAPALVALALIQSNVSAVKAIEIIRNKRKGAFNQKQISYLLKSKKVKTSGPCSIM
mmetsp:Transcript_16511/g.18355  ORF Transcript_16511/g.18355 Transcript_16511/m.18355 type:complete len:168 (+) Transcript_16511:156-659(+)